MSQVISVLPLAVVHTLGNLLTNVSLGQVAVSFTHTIKVCPSYTHGNNIPVNRRPSGHRSNGNASLMPCS
jgi:hypothetical protein